MESQVDLKTIIRDALEEFTKAPYQTELAEERKRREQLEHKMNELLEENRRSRAMAEEMERGNAIRAELQRLGVTKLDLAFRAVKDDVTRAADGRIVARGESGEVNLRDYLTGFVNENPELLPARMAGGSGEAAPARAQPAPRHFEIEKLRPGMDAEELDRLRREISRVAMETMGGV